MAHTDAWRLQLALGHASLRTTQRSAHVKPSQRTGITTRVRFGWLADEPTIIPFPRTGVRKRRWGNCGASR
jgi:hypothetical protein